jgi:hypothetical protein
MAGDYIFITDLPLSSYITDLAYSVFLIFVLTALTYSGG